MSDIPNNVDDVESLHRRIHPTFVRPDGSVSSQAFRDPEMSVDRGNYCTTEQTLSGYSGYGISAFLASFARQQAQEVVAAPDLLNPAHALVKGQKPKSVAREFARAASWVVKIGSSNAG